MNLPNVYCNLCKGLIASQFAGTGLILGGRSLKPKGDPGYPWFELGGDPHADLHLCAECLARLKNSLDGALPAGPKDA